MCLAIPARIEAIDSSAREATVALGGVAKTISLALVDDVAVGDYVLLHVGYALGKVSVEEAERTIALMVEAGLMEEAPAPTEEGP
jgi:hydrogenase expression/formation protein HypC